MWETNIRLYYQAFSKTQKQAADFLLDQGEKAGGFTLRQAAGAAGVGQNTIIRMLAACGYESWLKFQREVWKESRNDEGLRVYPSGRKQKWSEAVSQVIRDDVEMIADMVKLMDMDQLDKVVKIIKRAKVIDVYGTDNSANAAAELSGRLLHLGLTSRNYSDLFFQKVSAGHLGEKDVAISFSISGETIAVVDALNAAKQSGATTIAVTGDAGSALAEVADYVFMTPTIYVHEVSRWIASRISQIAFVDMMCAAVMESDKERFSRQLSISAKEFETDISDRVKH